MTQASSLQSAIRRTPHAQNTSAATPTRTIQDVPQEIMLQIFSNLSAPDASKASRVCREWNLLLNDNDLWKIFFNRDFKPRGDSSKVENAQKDYKACYILGSNLTNGVCAQHVLRGHTGKVECLAYANEFLFSGSQDKTIRVWHNRTLIRVLSGHKDGITSIFYPNGHKDAVTSLVYADELLCSGSADKTIKVWDIKTGDCLRTLEGHEGAITCLVDADGLLCSGSADNKIKVWDKDTGECLHTLKGHTKRFIGRNGEWMIKGIISLAYADDGKLISCAEDGTIRFWNIDTGDCLDTWDEDYTIRFWNIDTGDCLDTWDEDCTACSLAYSNGMLFAGFVNRTIVVWNLATGACLHRLKCDTCCDTCRVSSLVYEDGLLFACSKHSISIWNTDTGDCLRAFQRNLPFHGRGRDSAPAFANGRLFFSELTYPFEDDHITFCDFRFQRFPILKKSKSASDSCSMS